MPTQTKPVFVPIDPTEFAPRPGDQVLMAGDEQPVVIDTVSPTGKFLYHKIKRVDSHGKTIELTEWECVSMIDKLWRKI